MAPRKQLWHPEEVKEKIKMSQLLNRLQDNALAEAEFLTQGQIASINSLLDRVLPKLKAVEVTGPNGGPVELSSITRKIVDPKQGE